MKSVLIIILLSTLFITTGCIKSREINADEFYILNYLSTDERLPEKARLLTSKTLDKDTVREAEAYIIIENAVPYVPELSGWVKQYRQKQLEQIIAGGLLVLAMLNFGIGIPLQSVRFINFGLLLVFFAALTIMVSSQKPAEEFLKSTTPQIEHR
jgi:hypothetical protein